MKRWFLLSVALVLASVPAHAQMVDQCEWFIGSDPGPGNATPISIASADDSVSLAFTVATGVLSPGLYRVNIRCRSTVTGWGRPTSQLFAISPGSTVPRAVTQCEWRIDNGSATVIDPADDDSVTLNTIVATGAIPVGLHRFEVRCTDDLGRTGAYHSGLFRVETLNPPVVRLVTHLEYYLDNNPPTVLDVTDGATVNLNEILATTSLNVGMHRFSVRARDDLGRTGSPHTAFLIVTTPFGVAQPHTIAGAEIFFNSDPGPGNGVPIALPLDGLYDEDTETVDTVFTGIPIGLHKVCVRVRDDAGRWSVVECDSLIVGPVVVIHASGNDAILDWRSGSGVTQFYIFRANAVNGSYTRIDSTAAMTYTDPGILSAQDRAFYRVTFRADTLSSFRLAPADRPRD